MKRIVFTSLALLFLLTGCNCIPGMGNEPPIAYIDSISPSTAALGETVIFTGHGTDANGSVVGYKWRSSIDGDLSALASFDSASLSEGAHMIYFQVQDNNGKWSKEIEGSVNIGSTTATSPMEGDTYDTGGTPGTSANLPYIEYFTAEPGAISAGGSSTVSWNVLNADSVTISYGMSTNNVPPLGSATASPSTTTTYTLTATGGGTSVSATVDVVVSGTPGAPPSTGAGLPVINTFSANPQNIMTGGTSTLSYDVSNATTLTLAGGTKTGSLLHSSGTVEVTPSTSTTYTLTATNSAGSVTETTTVTVGPAVIVPGVILSAVKSTELSLELSESGSIYSDHTVSPKLICGDATTNKTFWAYFSFNISPLAGKEVTKAELVYSPSSINGKPWPDLGSLGIYQINHGPRALQPGDFAFIGPTIRDGISQIQTIVPADVTSQVASAAAASNPRFQVRLNFVKMTDNDGKADNIGWTSTTPKLRIKYR
jgi:hypothetical protein